MRLSFFLPVLVVLVAGLLVAGVLFLPSGGPPKQGEPGAASPNPTLSEVAGASPSVGKSSASTATITSSKSTEHPATAQRDLATATSALGVTTAESKDRPASEGGEAAGGGAPAATRQPESDTEGKPSSDGVIAGAVYSGKRIPLAGVTIQAGGTSVTSGQNGQFVLQGIKEPEVDVVASLEGYQTVTKRKTTTGTRNLSIILIQDNHLAGRVVDQYGKPVSYASIQLKALKGIWMLSIESDISGSFETDNVPNAKVRIAATREGLTDTGGGATVVDAPYPEMVLLRLERPSFSISGSVLLADTHQGVAGFALTARKQDEVESEPLEAVTSAGGAFRFDKLDIGVYLVTSNVTENQQLGIAIPPYEDNKTIRVFDKNVENVIFLALPGFTVSGRVVDSGGNGISGARVTLAQQSAAIGPQPKGAAQGQIESLSGADGHYQLQGIPWVGESGPGQLRIFASHSRYGSGLSEAFSLDPALRSVEDIDIRLTGVASLSGHVVSRQGQILEGARVTLIDLFQNTRQERMTDSGGGFVFEQVPITPERFSPVRGSHTLVVEKEGYATKRQDVLINSKNVSPLVIVLEEGGFIQGRALDSRGQGVPGVAVTVALPEGEQLMGRTNDAGVYSIQGIQPGVYDLLFRLDSKPPMYGALYQVETGTISADVTLQSMSWTVMGTVFDRQTSKPLTRYVLAIEGQLKDPQGGSFVKEETLNTPDGTYQLTFHEPGIFYIHFSMEGYQPWDGSVAMTPKTEPVQFVNAWLDPLETTGTIIGSVDLPAGFSLVRVQVMGHRDYEPTGPTSFVLEQVPTGKHSLVFYIRDEREAGARIYGVLAEVPVNPNKTTNLGVLTQDRFHVRVRGI